ncbi:uncharacterized protein BDR25DRAFT_265126 [Lindgomyces ingoldianus]|uniref:Uncharacterized protein n=1 Tax=Lindgomyces ingoldianus TaxID=673940 RepID=A0ACB6QN72_9PLEO|nr:uncharacterized protein BDR25DRAFT_265126 [Lindgomyces ingoldianus]KAF2468464.1 hypothetical protein BDR25DRAFT_265126 [Lindgomyces ingoldianus]
MASDSAALLEGQLHAATHPESADTTQKPAVKRSWRRKYRKMRAKFEDTMNTSNTLIKDEYKAIALARRLQEQNDQILDVLLDMNEATRLPAHLRFDLRHLSESDPAVSSREADADPDAVQRRIVDLREELVAGLITPEQFAQKVDQLHAAQPVIPKRTLASLEANTPYSTEVPVPAPEGIILGEHAPGYMSPVHEEEYLLAIDAVLENPAAYDPNAHDGRPLRIPPTHPIPNDKELSLRNPDSVYNWLRKNQPQVFLQDKDPHHPENLSEKSSARPGNVPGRGGKRPSAVSTSTPGPKTEQDALDEEIGFIPETGTGSTKRRRGGDKDDDPAYRPKGGASRPAKRKREDGDPVGKGGRKKANRASGGITTN